MKIQKKAFTLVELSVTIIIIAILASIGFYSYVGYISEARDAERNADMGVLKSALKVYHQDKGSYPMPGDTFLIENNGSGVVYQGKLNKSVALSTLDSLPYDPYKGQEYLYSITANRQEAQVAITLENGDFPIALLDGSYKAVAYETLPTIILAMENPGSDVEIHDGYGDGSTNRQRFILNKGENLPYSMTPPYEAVYGYDGSHLWDDVLQDGNVEYWLNSSYSSCQEIEDAGKSIGNDNYWVLDDTGTLTSTGCTF